MNIPEAIELQTQLVDLLLEVGFNKYIASTRLGMEALKYRLQLEQEDPDITLEPLPGETE